MKKKKKRSVVEFFEKSEKVFFLCIRRLVRHRIPISVSIDRLNQLNRFFKSIESGTTEWTMSFLFKTLFFFGRRSKNKTFSDFFFAQTLSIFDFVK
jgi:hypothetical protein